MDYLDQFDYSVYIAESMINRKYFKSAIRESVLTSHNENTVKNMNVLTEGVAETVKNAINKIVAALTRIWGRFTETLSALVKRDKDYLIKYKDIILKKGFAQNYTFSMYNYQAGQPNLLGTYAPAFNFNSLEQKLTDEKTFIGAYFPKIAQIQQQNKDINFSEALKIFFRGSEAEIQIPASKFNMTDAYNFCLSYKEIENKFQTDSKNIKAAAEQVQQKINELNNQQPSNSTPPPATSTPPTGTNSQPQKEAFDLFSLGSYKSFLYDNAILTEAEISVNGGNNQGGDTSPTPTTDPNKAVKNQDGQTSSDVNKNDVDNAGGSDASVKKIQIYIRVVGELMTAKLQVAEEMYKNYMQIIRAHVKDHVGKNDETDNKEPDKATTQGNDNTQNNNEKIDTSKLPG